MAELYRPLEFYMLRSPLLPMERFTEIFDTDAGIDRLIAWAEDPVVREAILVSSPSLLESLPNLRQTANQRKRDQAVRGFMRYLIRMITRCTPFGLFSGVASGSYGEQAALSLAPVRSYQKRSRPDMEWLLKIIERLESDPHVVEQLQVHWNPLAYRHGTRAKLPYVTRYGQQATGSETVSVRATPVVDLVQEKAAAPIAFADLVQHIEQGFGHEANREMIVKFLHQLFAQEFLISELRPPTTMASPLDYVLDRLAKVQRADDLRDRLTRIRQDIQAYDRLVIGEGEQALSDLLREMKDVADCQAVLQVDMALATEHATLPPSVGEEVATAAEILWRVAPSRNGLEHFGTYRNEFLERYGTYREVPLLELIDEDMGMGAPASYQFPLSRNQSGPVNPQELHAREALLLQWVSRALARKELEIELTEEMVRELEPSVVAPERAPSSLELNVSVFAASQQALTSGEYRLMIGPNLGSNGAGKTFGRFHDLLPENVLTALQAVHAAEQEMAGPDVLFAEISYLPNIGRAANIVLTCNTRPYEIACGTNSSRTAEHTIPLSDLVVGCTGRHFYLKSRSLGKEVIPTTCHMLNQKTAPNVYRFLYEAGLDRYRMSLRFRWGVLENSPFLPRLRHGRVILFPATWTLNHRVAHVDNGLSDAAWSEALQRWRAEWQVPRYVYLTDLDHRILLDLEHPLHVSVLRKQLEQQNSATLTEMGGDFSEMIVEGAEGRYANEFVFPLMRKVPDPQVLDHRHLNPPYSSDAERERLPGSDWLYLKLYGGHGREEELIGSAMREFCMGVQQQGLAKGSYFLRYADPQPHIRLRFHGEPDKLLSELMPRVHQWAGQLRQEGLLSRLVIDTYNPEIERYGGPELMQRAEQMFVFDSMAVAAWIYLKRFGQPQIDFDMLGVLSIIDIMESFGLSFGDQLAYFDKRFGMKEYLTQFRTDRQLYLQLANSQDDWAGLRNHPQGMPIFQTFQMRRSSLQAYAKSVRQTWEEGALQNFTEDIMASVIHMHLNRMYGTDRDRERRVMIMTRHTLQALRHFKEKE